MSRVSDTMSQENVFPTNVLILSMVSSIFCIFDPSKNQQPERQQRSGCSSMMLWNPLTFLRRSCLRWSFLLAEVMVISHTRADHGVELPAHRALSEFTLRFEDLLEQRVLSRIFFHDLIENFKLLLEHRIRRLVHPDLVLGLQFDVVL